MISSYEAKATPSSNLSYALWAASAVSSAAFYALLYYSTASCEAAVAYSAATLAFSAASMAASAAASAAAAYSSNVAYDVFAPLRAA